MSQPTADDVRRTYERFRGDWDFEKQGRLRLSLIWQTAIEVTPRISRDPPAPVVNRIVEVRKEYGWIERRRAIRLVARLNEPEIEVVLAVVCGRMASAGTTPLFLHNNPKP